MDLSGITKRQILEGIKSVPYNGFGKDMMYGEYVEPINEKELNYEITPKEELGNFTNNLHGGAIASLADNISTYLLLINDPTKGSTTIHLSTDYYRPIPIGSTVRIQVILNKFGKNISYMTINFYLKEGNILCASAVHIKAFVNIPKL